MPPDTENENQNPQYVHPQIAVSKQLRKDLDALLQTLKSESTPPKGLFAAQNQAQTQGDTASESPRPIWISRERSLAVTKIQEAIMWLGMDLKAMHESGLDGATGTPYPHSKDPSSPVIEKTADGLKL